MINHLEVMPILKGDAMGLVRGCFTHPFIQHFKLVCEFKTMGDKWMIIVINSYRMFNYEIKTSFFSPEVPKAPAS